MDTLRIYLFGQPRVYDGETRLKKLPTCKAQGLFCYLVLQRQRRHPRNLLANLFWGDCPEQQARKCLRTTLWRLRRYLEPEDTSKGTYLIVDNDEVCFNAHSNYWLDIEEFDNCVSGLHLATASDIEAGHLDEQALTALTRAVELYQGDLLEGCYEDWCLYQRERLQGMFLSSLARLMGYYHSQGLYEEAIRCGQRILSVDSVLEEVHREMMRLHCLAGNRGAALRQYHLCQALLARELDVEPMEETTALYNRIGQNEDLKEHGPAVHAASVPMTLRPSPQLLPQSKATHPPLTTHVEAALTELRLAQEALQQSSTRFQKAVQLLQSIKRDVANAKKLSLDMT